jgi:hypothetical protein
MTAVSQGHGETDLDTTQAQRISSTMASQKPLTKEDASRWVSYWLSKGM